MITRFYEVTYLVNGVRHVNTEITGNVLLAVALACASYTTVDNIVSVKEL